MSVVICLYSDDSHAPVVGRSCDVIERRCFSDCCAVMWTTSRDRQEAHGSTWQARRDAGGPVRPVKCSSSCGEMSALDKRSGPQRLERGRRQRRRERDVSECIDAVARAPHFNALASCATLQLRAVWLSACRAPHFSILVLSLHSPTTPPTPLYSSNVSNAAP